jgi:uncharacterized protein YgfB (UPF0149 family)
MSDKTPIDSRLGHSELAQALRVMRLGVDASDLHGSLSGYFCGGGDPGEGDWLAALALEPDDPAVARSVSLRRFFRECRAQFAQSPASVDPLLPRAGGLAQRAAALAEWCRGFLGGFGLSGAATRATLSAEASEILADIGTIAGTNFEPGDSREDAAAFEDLLDFARMAAAVLYRERQRGVPARSLH